MTDDHDQVFFSLPQIAQRRIDKAFDTFLKRDDSDRPKKKRKVAHTPDLDLGGGFVVEETPGDSGGGFLVEDNPPITGGGFLVDEEEAAGASGADFIPEDDMDVASSKSDSTPEQIPFSSIPSALQLLDLPPDDEQVLNVFRNAASGWDDNHAKFSLPRGSGSTVDAGGSENVEMISREDWRAVCAILIEQQGGLVEGPSEALSLPGSSPPLTPSTRPTTRQSSRRTSRGASLSGGAQILVEDSDDDRDQYQEEEEVPDDAEDEEYVDLDASASHRRRRQPAGGSASAKTRRARGRAADSDISEYDDNESDSDSGAAHKKSKSLTARQKEACLTSFALFFPDVDPNDLPKKKIMLRDIQRVAGLLKEKIKAEEMVEMLEAFSTQPDKSMSLEDFERMMVAAKLI
ncbi:hypothetical protein D9758_000866 [Tetrapyrgos nigripes]|uniref:Uncharacterized protein n=1 Tax=Tetrapyrgos nigripes TaxID=182062 RepID=A0A8H5LY54_9AGAR|nr:hypothetical protein D9758_000866 [Tetrapyrgos nigripes]